MGLCQSLPPPLPPPPEPALPPDSPTWKLPPFPAPALPPLTRQNKVIITASMFMDDPDEAQKTKRHVLNGSGEALSIVFDAGDLLEEFIPEVRKLFSLAFSISSIELHTANLDVEPTFLQTFLDTLPSHGELRAFSLITARETPLVFSTISGLMYRNPKLMALRLWGVDLSIAGTGNQYFPQCRLLRVDIAHCRMHPEQLNVLLGSSKDSLLCLKLERLIGIGGSFIARAVKNYAPKCQMLTILLPGESDSEMDMTATYLVGDTASRFPKSLKYLHLGGLAASDNLFTITPLKDQKPGETPKSHLATVVALRLDDCPRLSVNGLLAAVRHGHLPNLLRLHAYWLENDEALADVEIWKQFAASQDINVDLQEEGLVWLTAMKEGPPAPDPEDVKKVKAPKDAHLDPSSAARIQNLSRPGMPHSYPPGAYLHPSYHPQGQTQAGGKSHRHHRSSKKSSRRARRRHRRNTSSSGSSSSSDSSSSSSDSSDSSDDSDSSGDTAYYSSRSRGHSGGRSGRSRSTSRDRRYR